jgi:hypothetical protein
MGPGAQRGRNIQSPPFVERTGMDESLVDECDDRERERARQERDVELSHALITAEFALVREGVELGRALAAVGLSFDPATFVTMRVLEACLHQDVEALPALDNDEVRDLIARSTTVTRRILAADPRQLAAG